MSGEAAVCEGCKTLAYGAAWLAVAGLMYDGSPICDKSKRHSIEKASSNL